MEYVWFLTVLELQILLKARGLAASGDKRRMCERLVEHLVPRLTQELFLGFLTVYELKVLLKARGVAVGGLKIDLITRLVGHCLRST